MDLDIIHIHRFVSGLDSDLGRKQYYLYSCYSFWVLSKSDQILFFRFDRIWVGLILLSLIKLTPSLPPPLSKKKNWWSCGLLFLMETLQLD